MIVNIQRVDGKGFMAFKEEFNLEIDEFNGKTIQIDGLNKDDEVSISNGSGKSTLLESIYWGSYGKLCRKNKYQDEVINKKSNCTELITHFNKGDDQYKIYRTIERKKSPTLQIFQNDEELLDGATYQTKQNHLEKILGMDSLSFLCSVMYGQGFMSFPDLKPAERAKVLTELRGLDRYTEASIKSGDMAKQIGLNVQIVSDKLKTEEGRLQGIRATNYTKESEEFERFKTDSICSWSKEIEEKEGEKRKYKDSFEIELIGIQNKINQTEKELEPFSNLAETRKATEEIWYSQQGLLSQAISNRGIISEKIIEINKKTDKLLKQGEGECPFCSQAITGAYLQSLINQLGLEKMELESKEMLLEEQIKELQSTTKDAKKNIDQIRLNEEKANKIKSDLESLKNQVKGKKDLFEQSIKTIDREILSYNSLIEKKKKETNPFIEKEKERKENIKKIGIVIRGYSTEIAKLETEKKYYEIWTTGFKKIRMMLFETMIENLETLIQSFMSKYSSELSVVLTTERETRSGTIKDEFHIGIVDSDGIELSYEMYSGGEKQKVRLSIARALAQFIKDDCGIEFNIIAFDEPNESLDDAGKETNFETFQELSEKENKCVLVTDHDANFKDRFSTTITVVRENKESTIQYG